MYSDFIFNELKSIYASLESIDKLELLVQELLELHGVARKEGLLALEDVVLDLVKSDKFSKTVLEYMKNMYGMIVDGVDKTLVRRYGILRYIKDLQSNMLNDIDRLAYIIIMYAVEYTQDGYNPRLAEYLLRILIK